MNLSRPPSSRSSATSAYWTLNTFASVMLTSSGVTPSPRTDPRGSRFSGRMISSMAPSSGLWVIGVTRKKSISQPLSVSHFEHQTAPVMTSYNPFGISKVANGHDLLGHGLREDLARKP